MPKWIDSNMMDFSSACTRQETRTLQKLIWSFGSLKWDFNTHSWLDSFCLKEFFNRLCLIVHSHPPWPQCNFWQHFSLHRPTETLIFGIIHSTSDWFKSYFFYQGINCIHCCLFIQFSSLWSQPTRHIWCAPKLRPWSPPFYRLPPLGGIFHKFNV